VTLISLVVLLMFVAALLESGIWAAVYMKVGAISDLETALYFSIVTFTTLGYGDVTLDTSWRLLASLQAANGTIMFGWTTALVMAVIRRMAGAQTAAADAHS
jgi:voltage-gated potassium channel Kch